MNKDQLIDSLKKEIQSLKVRLLSPSHLQQQYEYRDQLAIYLAQLGDKEGLFTIIGHHQSRKEMLAVEIQRKNAIRQQLNRHLKGQNNTINTIQKRLQQISYKNEFLQEEKLSSNKDFQNLTETNNSIKKNICYIEKTYSFQLALPSELKKQHVLITQKTNQNKLMLTKIQSSLQAVHQQELNLSDQYQLILKDHRRTELILICLSMKQQRLAKQAFAVTLNNKLQFLNEELKAISIEKQKYEKKQQEALQKYLNSEIKIKQQIQYLLRLQEVFVVTKRLIDNKIYIWQKKKLSKR